MAETSGFFNAEELVDGSYDREYVAEQWADYFKLFIGNGVFVSPTNQLKVRENSGLTVKVLPGWAWINGYWYHNDANLTLNIPINATAQTRTDGIFIRWNSNTREITTIVGEGRTTVNRTSPYYELKIAEVTVATGATSITDAVITDTRGNDDVCGFVKSLMEVISTEDLFAQFQSEFSTWLTESQDSYNTWITQQEGSFEAWRTTQQVAFTQWFQHLHDELDENQAAHLQNEIDDIYQKLEQTAHPVTISVTDPPVKTTYDHGDTLDLTGITVTALYSDNHTENITSQCTFSPANGATLSDTMTAVNISWVWTLQTLHITYTTTQAITVNSVLSSIAITTPPTKNEYEIGESLDLTGVVVTATYSSARTANVTSGCTFTPPDGTTFDTDGTVSLTASYTERGVTKTASTNIVVKPAVSAILDENSWETIQKVAQAGEGANWWSVGDRKAVTLNGTVGKKVFSNQTAYVYILGFNHNQAVEGTAIHFMFGTTSAQNDATYITFVDNTPYDEWPSLCFSMNPPTKATGWNYNDSTNAGGWEQSRMRNQIIPAFINALPSSLRAVLKTVTKYTDNTGNGSTAAANVTATQDKVFLLGAFEYSRLGGTYNHTNGTEAYKQVQYTFYENGNFPRIYKDTDPSTMPDYFWNRSPYKDNGKMFLCGQCGYDGPGWQYACVTCGFSPAFAVG